MTQGTTITDPAMIALYRHLTLESGLHLQACMGLMVSGRKISVIVRDELRANGWEGSYRNLKDLLALYQDVLMDTYRGALTQTLIPRCGCIRVQIVESNLY